MTSVKRLNYSTGQFLTATDFQVEQNYHRSLRRLHHKYMHTPGVAGGLDVTGSNGSAQVVVAPGLALDANGAEIALIDPFTIDLSGRSDSGWFLITANYAEFNAAADNGTAGAANLIIPLRCTEQPSFVLFAVDGPVSLKPATAGGPVPTPGIQIGIAAIQLNAGKLAAINSAAPARQQAGSRLDPATTLAGLKVGGDTNLAGLAVSGTANFAGASNFTGAAGFAGLKASGDVAVGGKLGVAGNTVVGASQTRTWLSVGGGLDNELHYSPTLAIRNPNPVGISNGTEFSQGQDSQNCATFNWTPDNSGISVSNGKPLLLQAASGNVGIGNSNPQGTLHLSSNTGANPQIFLSGVPAYGENGLRIHYNHDAGNNVAVMDVKGAAFAIRGEAGIGTGVTERLAIRLDTGNLGIGTPGPQEKLHVAGAFLLVDGAGGEKVYLGGDSGVYSPGPAYPGATYNAPARPDVQLGSTNPNVTTVTMYNRSGGGFLMDMACRYMYGTKVGYVVDQFINATGDPLSLGDVVVIGSNQASLAYGPHGVPVPEVDLTSTPYNTKVCGIVSDVEAASPHRYEALQGDAQSEGLPIEARQIGHMATLGAFAHCKVDADIAAIEIGDLLTTSSTPGHAQKVLDRSQAIGAIIGKALAPLANGQGKIPVMVMMQ